MPSITPKRAPIKGPIYGITLISPAKKPMRKAFLISKIESPVLTITVIIRI